MKKAGDAESAMKGLAKVNHMPEKYSGGKKSAQNSNNSSSTINMLEALMFNLNQLKVDNYVQRRPKYLFKVVQQKQL